MTCLSLRVLLRYKFEVKIRCLKIFFLSEFKFYIFSTFVFVRDNFQQGLAAMIGKLQRGNLKDSNVRDMQVNRSCMETISEVYSSTLCQSVLVI